MTGCALINTKPRTKTFVSDLDYDNRLGSYFKMYIEPKEYYSGWAFALVETDTPNYKYQLEGEGYLVCGKTEEEIDAQVRKHRSSWRRYHPNVSVGFIYFDKNYNEVDPF